MIRKLSLILAVSICTAGSAFAQSDIGIKHGLGISATMQEIVTTLDKAHEQKILTKVECDAYGKRLQDIRADLESKKLMSEKLSFAELSEIGKQLSVLVDDVNRKVEGAAPEAKVTAQNVQEQYTVIKSRISGALNIGRLTGNDAKTYRDQAKRIISAMDTNDDTSIQSTNRQLSRLQSKLQIATARSQTARIDGNLGSYLTAPRAF